MIKNYITIVLLLFLTTVSAQTIWDSENITFTKEDNADFTLEENQDRITDNVWITRGNTQGIFNIADEASFVSGVSPSDTEWSFGTTADLDNLTFANWQTAIGNDPQGSIDQPLVLHLITDDIFIDLTFTSFSGGGPGGGFSYIRASEPALGINDFSASKVEIYPNPVIDELKISGLSEKLEYSIYNVLGARITFGSLENNTIIPLHSLNKGVYFLTLSNGQTKKFVKN